MTLNLGPAVGAKGQIGFAEEGKWGKQSQTPTDFVEMASEGIVSEIGSLISNSLRPDRAVHKRVRGVEACGGDVSCEIGPSGFEKWFKHALGSVVTTRLDKAFAIECTDPDETSAVLTITHTAGAATELKVEFVVNVANDLTLDLTNTDYDTLAELMVAINANPVLAAWSPYQLTQGSYSSTLDATNDYCAGADNSKVLEATANIDLMKTGTIGNRIWIVGTSWGIYQHVIDAAANLPEGMTVEVGRDVAAFMYSGMKVNTLELSATPGEFFMGTFGLMGKGGSTADNPKAATGNTGHEKDAFKIRYTGVQATATLTIDTTKKNLELAIDGTTEDVVLNLTHPLIVPSSGRVYNVDRLGGLVAYLDNLNYIDCEIKDYADPSTLSVNLKAAASTSIVSTTFVNFPFALASVPAVPIVWGDYIGTDVGDPDTFYVKCSLAGVPGTAKLTFKKNDGTYGNEVITSATKASEIRTGTNVNSGFTIFFPDVASLNLDDVWTIKTIRTPATTSYPAIDPFSGFEGAFTLDGAVAEIMGWGVTLNNNLYGDKYKFGTKVRAQLPEQRKAVEGTLTVEFDNLDLYRKFVNGVQANIVVTFTSPTYITNSVIGNSATQYSLAVRMPRIEFSGETPTIDDEGIITPEMPFVGLFDDTNNVPEIRITVVSTSAYI